MNIRLLFAAAICLMVTAFNPAHARKALKTSLSEGQSLLPGQSILSANRQYKLILQTDGNLCVRRISNDQFVWGSSTKGGWTPNVGYDRVTLKNGTIFCYANNVQKWSSATKYPNGKLIVSDEGEVQILDANNRVVWPLRKVNRTAPGTQLRR